MRLLRASESGLACWVWLGGGMGVMGGLGDDWVAFLWCLGFPVTYGLWVVLPSCHDDGVGLGAMAPTNSQY